MRVYPVLLLLVLITDNAIADWTGISAGFGESSSNWVFENGTRKAQVNHIGLTLEEKTNSALRVGASIGHMSIRVSNQVAPADTDKYDASFIGLYLRLPLKISQRFGFNGILAYRYNTGSKPDEQEMQDIEWHETEIQLGFSIEFESIRISPYSAYRHVSGDVSSDSTISVFDLEDSASTGLKVDYIIEPFAYIRLQLSAGDNEAAYLTFAKEY